MTKTKALRKEDARVAGKHRAKLFHEVLYKRVHNIPAVMEDKGAGKRRTVHGSKEREEGVRHPLIFFCRLIPFSVFTGGISTNIWSTIPVGTFAREKVKGQRSGVDGKCKYS